MEFMRYLSLKRFGTDEVEGIELGKCYIFPKIDGTNASVWYEDGIKAGSRNRTLSVDNDNADFCKWAEEEIRLKYFFQDHPHLRLFGEWLVPHTITNYRDDMWKRFWIFDVYDNQKERYLEYDEYYPLVAKYELDLLLCTHCLVNPTIDILLDIAPGVSLFGMKDGYGQGEGIVIKNYGFVNKYGRYGSAKVVLNEFREKHIKEFGKNNMEIKKSVEELIIDDFCTKAFVEKEYAKILLRLENEGSHWQSKNIPELLGRVFSELVSEECWNFVKKHKNPNIDFRALNGLTTMKVIEVFIDRVF
ncbi:MAG: RNA ligase family protein [Cellulosilyticaceae bacterium]